MQILPSQSTGIIEIPNDNTGKKQQWIPLSDHFKFNLPVPE
jgi:hypothetical protein